MNEDQLKVTAMSLFGFVLGIILFIMGFKWLKFKRMIENIPTSKVRSIAMGLVEISGTVLPAKKNILKSPFSNRDCVYYRFTIEEYRQEGKHSRWVTKKRGEKSTHFFLQDETGKVLVDANGAEIDIPMKNEFRSKLGIDPPKEVMSFLTSEGISFEGIFGLNRTMRYREYFIEPKETMYIMGTADDNPFVEEATAVHGMEDVMIKKGENEKFYYISNKPEQEVLAKYKWKTIGGIFGGAILTILCLFIFLASTGLL